MIIFGHNSKYVVHEPNYEDCTYCNSKASVSLYIYQKYAHVFWIPMFPLRKVGVSECSHCKQVLRSKQMPASLKSRYEKLKSESRTPLWIFSGTFLLIVLVSSLVFISNKKTALTKKYIAAPQAGDIMKIRTSTGHYTLLRIADVREDSVFIQFNQYEINKSGKLHTLESEPFSEDVFILTKEELQEKYNSGDIFNVDRKKN
ncbi:hypothetical protein [Gynurincola endophyticus]|uniref:hypothetical protein n=1 Tax=Gynurincola endophyticus TaxID=2479004 RepID=UPI000F8D8903|nr:hypothetical protein [Gynurincola endophyticus]